ncbi:MerR family transcriptional regulator [Clostridium pasteurianum]|uniref:Putative transcriptional regulator n=1 Tax=Clostridium pasteurianum BC1 TaxID=86416 RepID=R4K9G6_CLOPA|nr:MerR family transcriptional regulator [Clostridium pasteurianum]AGK98341.1 putative transcriptional regulator [Clostridium pasteurianum BC1]
MYYTISEISKKVNISPYTLRFYAKEGLFPFVDRSENGIRMFKDEDFEWLFMIDCLKKTGMSLKDIKTFVEWAMQGDETIDQRLNMFQEQRKAVEAQIAQLQDTLDVLKYKCWYYETAKAAGTTAVPRAMQEDHIPDNVRYVRKKSQKIHKLG